MQEDKFYDKIIEDINSFDKVIYDLEQMEKNAPNARIRTLAIMAKTNLQNVLEVSYRLKKDE